MSEGRVIRTFQERLEIEKKLQALAEEQNPQQRMAQAQSLAQHGQRLIPVILRHLKTTDPLLRSALGLIAMHLPRDLIAPSLYQVVSDPQRSDQERIAALTILDRFLGEDIEESMYAALRDPYAIMEQAVRELTEHLPRMPEIIIDFVNQLEEEPPEVPLMLLDILDRFPGEHVFPILVALAYDQRPNVAEPALHKLGQNPHPDALPTLLTLADVLPVPQKTIAERNARKLRLKGAASRTYSPTPWRTFASAPDIQGTQAFWLLRNEASSNLLISLLGNIDLGLQFAFVLDDIPAEFIPPPSTPDRIASIPLDISVNANERRIAWLKEVPVAHMRRWLKHLIAQNYSNEYTIPTMYRLNATQFWQETQHEGIAEPPPLPEFTHRTLPDPHHFFNHEAFILWSLIPERDPLEVYRETDRPLSIDTFYTVLRHIRANDFAEGTWHRLARRLLQVAEWFTVIGDTRMATQTVTVAHFMRTTDYAANPFAHVLVERGVFEAFQRLRQEREETS